MLLHLLAQLNVAKVAFAGSNGAIQALLLMLCAPDLTRVAFMVVDVSLVGVGKLLASAVAEVGQLICCTYVLGRATVAYEQALEVAAVMLAVVALFTSLYSSAMLSKSQE